MTENRLENTEYLIFKETLGSGIRNKSLLNLMWVELKLYEQYFFERNKENLKLVADQDPRKIMPKQIRFSTYLRDKNRLNDIQTLLKCSERTARDYWKTLLYSELMNNTKLEAHQRNIKAHFQDKD